MSHEEKDGDRNRRAWNAPPAAKIMFNRIEAFVREIRLVDTPSDLADAIAEIGHEMGFAYFALTHHVDIRRATSPVIRLANYPSVWVEYFDGERLGLSDPVHRASHRTNVGFAWSRLGSLIDLGPRDRQVLDLAARCGIGDGFTVPAHVPGESNGSCSFATQAGIPLSPEQLPAAQLIGAYAFEAARRLWRMRDGAVHGVAAGARLTDRQRDCVVLVARGKSDGEIATILGLKEETVTQYVKRARERYDASRRSLLIVQALFEGEISFTDVLRR